MGKTVVIRSGLAGAITAHPSIVNCVYNARRISPVNLYNLPLVGDEAHGMFPFMVQGLCQLIEDAVNLCDLFGHYQDTDFAKYDEIHRSSSSPG
ncbi:hypothetical protein HDU79_000923 [Rhizoclosmatium sp. JEL0117]|nr:hypothetical protein HDU79_000923 [Rhizoclosmatium sp. JEL0117]